MPNIFVEENGRYCIDCSKALWATDKMHDEYQRAGIHINDVDFVIENEDCLILLSKELKIHIASIRKNRKSIRLQSENFTILCIS